MHPLSEPMLRASFVNTSLRERVNLPIPDLHHVYWDDVDFLGWQDRRNPGISYLATEIDDEPVAILLHRSATVPRMRAQCSWCEDVLLPNDVVFFSAKTHGGGTLGTLACANFECPANVRKRPSLAYVGFDVEQERQRRISVLRRHVATFVRKVRDASRVDA